MVVEKLGRLGAQRCSGAPTQPWPPESPSELTSTATPLCINRMVRQIWKLDTGEKRWLSPQECAGQLRFFHRGLKKIQGLLPQAMLASLQAGELCKDLLRASCTPGFQV